MPNTGEFIRATLEGTELAQEPTYGDQVRNALTPAAPAAPTTEAAPEFAPFIGYGRPPGALDRQGFVEGQDYYAAPDFDEMGRSLAGAYERAGATGLSSARGKLARSGLTGTGAEVATDIYAGNLAGRAQTDIEQKLTAGEMSFNQMKVARKDAYDRAKSAYDQGNFEFAQEILLQYDKLTAEINMRNAEAEAAANSGGGLGSALLGLGGAFLGGPGGGVVAKSLLD